jgi:formylglycine-generating enzyme required for sulfatase activity
MMRTFRENLLITADQIAALTTGADSPLNTVKEQTWKAITGVSVPPGSTGGTSTLTNGRVGQTYTANLPGGQTLTLCYCPSGSFTMGSPASEADRSEDEQQVRVTLSHSYWMGRTEVTQAQWSAVMGSNPSNFKGDKLPVETISWSDADVFVKKLNAQVPLPGGWVWALPTETEWEYACRAGTTTATAFGSSLSSEQASFHGAYPYGSASKGRYLEKTCDVASYSANEWGLHDMHGNVWEWCADAWDGTSKLPGGTDPRGSAGSSRVIRGGSWFSGGHGCRLARRSWNDPGNSGNDLGVRVAAVPAGAR